MVEVVLDREAEKFRGDGVGGWALTWYREERQETGKAKSEGLWYWTPKSSTTKTKVIG